MNLSKSKYCRGIQCPKMLWMDKHMPEKAADMGKEEIFKTGDEVGDLAMGYFGSFVEVPYADNKSEMIAKTAELIDSGVENICEASFGYKGLFCSVDILHRNGDGWDIVEVKSSTKLHDIYLHDMAFQCYVLIKNGLNIKGVYNLHLNSEYVRNGELDLKKLFTLEDCTETVFDMQCDLPGNIEAISGYVDGAGDTEPYKDISVSCEDPYECAYKGWCGRHLPSPSIFDVYRVSTKKKYEFYDSGIVSFEDIIEKRPKLNKNQYRQIETAYYHLPDEVDKENIRACISEYTYPLYHLDFETTQFAVPPYEGMKPFQQMPFQYSLHVQQYAGAEPEHYEFLGKEGTDPRRALAEQLCADIPDNVCVLAYNMAFEKGRIKELAEMFPDLSAHLMSIHDNIVDLMVPFQKQYYYSEKLCGSYSIKYVLPAFCPDDPELDYHALEGIHKGDEASAAFADLPNHTPDEIAVIRKNLLAYCRLDTLAMVKILDKLRAIAE
ncbi:MAG: DUF2779 domain-containing protein [Clostridiales bacterium]|nr:DUF2779 domain-containing protein [Clostridiales bacterium]